MTVQACGRLELLRSARMGVFWVNGDISHGLEDGSSHNGGVPREMVIAAEHAGQA
jgi:hypothetical protein